MELAEVTCPTCFEVFEVAVPHPDEKIYYQAMRQSLNKVEIITLVSPTTAVELLFLASFAALDKRWAGGIFIQ